MIPLVFDYIQNGFTLIDGLQSKYYKSITGLMLIMFSFIVFSSSLVLHSLAVVMEKEKV
jgi:hypothetical protein